jgi:hypothetical protein
MNFFIFWLNKIRISLTGGVSSLSLPWCRLSSSQRRHAATSCHAFFSLSQDELAKSASSSDNVLSRHLSSRDKTKTLNLHHRRRLPPPDCPTPTLDCYRKIILTLIALYITQLCLHFVSSVVRALRHRSSTRRRGSFSPLSSLCTMTQMVIN